MSDEKLREHAPLAALGALDGEDRVAFEAGIGSSAAAQDELRAFEELVGRIGLATPPVEPSPAVRHRVLRSARTRWAPTRAWALPALAAAVILSLLAGVLVLRSQRDAARQEAASRLDETQRVREELDSLRQRLAEESAFRGLLAHPDSRVASLAGLPAAPQARGRVVWNPSRGEAVLVASGLTPAPEGKAYEVWVIGQAAPVPAGLFQVDAQGGVTFRLPAVEELRRVRTFAVTLEPATGVPVPTGPMVLAGAAS